MNEAAARVLGALRSASGPCSGEDLSTALGVSRAAGALPNFCLTKLPGTGECSTPAA